MTERNLVRVLANGSEATIETGVASSRAEPNGNYEAWFPDDSTIALGVGKDVHGAHTRATWRLDFDAGTENAIEDAFLIIACARPQGGVHTQREGALVHIELNGHKRDIIGLKDISADHTDYFHRPPLPRIPEFWPISGCGTIYAWPFQRNHLSPTGTQSVAVEIEDDIVWDIDYVALCCTKPDPESRSVRRRAIGSKDPLPVGTMKTGTYRLAVTKDAVPVMVWIHVGRDRFSIDRSLTKHFLEMLWHKEKAVVDVGRELDHGALANLARMARNDDSKAPFSIKESRNAIRAIRRDLVGQELNPDKIFASRRGSGYVLACEVYGDSTVKVPFWSDADKHSKEDDFSRDPDDDL